MAERRLFSWLQKARLLLRDNYTCQSCGVQVTWDSCHADHIKPHSKGGLTNISNGQILCIKCNLTKSNHYTLNHNIDQYLPAGHQYREWQARFLQKFFNSADVQLRQELSQKQPFVLDAFPATGKSLSQSVAILHLVMEKLIDFAFICVPTISLRDQFVDDSQKIGLKLQNCKSGIKFEPGVFHGYVVTYAQLANESTANLINDLCEKYTVMVSADEMHHLADQRSWGTRFLQAFSNTDVRLLTSGTPFRSDQMPMPWVEYDDEGKMIIDEQAGHAFRIGYADALEMNYVRRVVFRAWDGLVKFSLTKEGTDQTKSYEHTMKENLEKIYGGIFSQAKIDRLKSARRKACVQCDKDRPQGSQYVQQQLLTANKRLDEIRAYGHSYAGGLIICDTIEHAEHVRNLVQKLTGDRAVLVTSEDRHAKGLIKDFKENKTPSRAKWLVAVGMVSEGIDIPHLRVCVYLSTITAPLTWVQVVGRVLRVENNLNGDQTAEFFQYDDGVGYVPESDPPEETDVRIRKYAAQIKNELDELDEARIRTEKPKVCPKCGQSPCVCLPPPPCETCNGEPSLCPGPLDDSCPKNPRYILALEGAEGIEDGQVLNNVRHTTKQLEPYIRFAHQFRQPQAGVKEYHDGLSGDQHERFTEFIQSLNR
ncbi:HNH endonuclease [Synechococcus sp. AH-601-B19]|nr:HNH endonuclease [Synechococcus sp. AH-601-B19]